MELNRAIEILSIEKVCAMSDLQNGQGNIRTEEFADAVDTVLAQLEEDKIIFSLVANIIMSDFINHVAEILISSGGEDK